VQPHYPAIRANGADLVAVTMTQPAFLTAYLKEHPWPFPVVTDPGLESYRTFGLERAAMKSFFRWKVLAGYLRLIGRGFMPRRPIAGEDVQQLGGEFILDEGRNLIYAFRSDDPTQHPDINELLKLLRK
jgi:peroxiredoxin